MVLPERLLNPATESELSPVALPGLIVRVTPVRLIRDGQCWRWCIPHCPFCGASHVRFAATLDADPWAALHGNHPAGCNPADRRRLKVELGTDSLWYRFVAEEPGAAPTPPQSERTG